MKLRSLFFVTFGFSAAAGCAAALAAVRADFALAVPAIGVAVIAVVALAWIVAARFRQQLMQLERVVALGDDAVVDGVFIAELHHVADRLREHAFRWTEATMSHRQLKREVDELLEQLKSSETENSPLPEGPAARQLSRLLAGVAQAAEKDFTEILASTQEIRQSTHEIASGVDEQAASVNRTTSYVEQMSSNIDGVSQNAQVAQQATVSARESAGQALKLIDELVQGIDRIRLHVEASEKKLRALGDRSNEIGSIVETIGTISSRTDLLALNASIESVRAGEHGRGFAVVAEEVRNLAEQAAQATREVSALIESIQLETQESIAVMAEEHAQVQAEAERVNAAGATLEEIRRNSQQAERSVDEISRAAERQLGLTQEVVLAMERISEVARQSRNRAEGLSWSAKTLEKLVEQLGTSLSPLKGCSTSPSSAFETGSDREKRTTERREPILNAPLAADSPLPEGCSQTAPVAVGVATGTEQMQAGLEEVAAGAQSVTRGAIQPVEKKVEAD